MGADGIGSMCADISVRVGIVGSKSDRLGSTFAGRDKGDQYAERDAFHNPSERVVANFVPLEDKNYALIMYW